MRIILPALLFIFLGTPLFSQTSGNEWINFGVSGKYYIIKVAQDGIYRIDYTTLASAGIPVGSVNPKNFQVYGREKEQFIFVKGEQDNSFDPGDYIEFYGKKNDGSLDSLLYTGGSASMPSADYSLYNDTICYYLTWNNSLSNRRMQLEEDTLFASYSPDDYIWSRIVKRHSLRYLQGDLYNGASSSFFTRGEGWYGDFIYANAGGSQLDVLATPFPLQTAGAPDAMAKCVIAGSSNATSFLPGGINHHMRVMYGPSNTLIVDTTFTAYEMVAMEFSYPNAALSGSGSRILFQGVNDLGISADVMNVAFSEIIYPRMPNLNSQTTLSFLVDDHLTQNKRRIDFVNPPAGEVFVYQLGDTLRKIKTVLNGTLLSVLIPDANSRIECFLHAESAVINVSQLEAVNGSGEFTDYAQINPDSVFLIITHASLLNAAQQYAAYRNSPAGGSYDVLVVDVEELYHQYGGGVQKHALAVKRFIGDVSAEWDSAPSHLFLIGKSVREATESANGTFHGTRKSAAAFQSNLVPSFGYPSSDALLTAGIGSTQMQAFVPTGRLAAQNEQMVLDYLSKMQEFESAQDPSGSYTIQEKEWMKKIMHFGGGSTTNEQNDFSYYLSVFESIAEDTSFGADVHTFLKQSSDPIDPVEFDEVMTMIENGVSMMTFFGHSSINGFDQNLDEPTNWNNQGKYPFLLGNACYTGDIHQPDGLSASENFVLEPQKGVIGFLSATKLGFVSSLYTFSAEFYFQFSRDLYGATVGQILQRTVQLQQPPLIGDNIPQENVCTQMTLHGDPAMRLNPHPAPELVVRAQDVFFEPQTVTLADDSINVNIILTNIGKATPDSIIVELRRNFPSGADSVYTQVLPGSYFRDTLVFRIPVLHNIASGINTMEVSVDIPSFVQEHADESGNNQVSVPLFISSNGIFPVFPYEYAIVPDSAMDLKASTYNPLIGTRTYRFEIDTTDAFNSPQHRYQLITASGGVIIADYNNWLLSSNQSASPLLFSDSTVYFWRVSPDSAVYSWHNSSFQYISGQEGWAQAHFYQFEKNDHQSMRYDRTDRGWFWDPNIRRIGCDVFSFAWTSNEFFGTMWTIDGDMQDYSGCGIDPAIHVAVIDPLTLEPWGTYGCDPVTGGACPSCIMVNADHQFGNANDGCACRNRVEYYFSFRNNQTAEMDSLLSMVNNHIPDGYYVLLYTWRYADYSFWTPSHFSMMDALGAGDSIYAGRSNESWIVLAKKGDPTFTKVVMGQTSPGFVSMNDTLLGFDFAGSMHAVVAGPALNWNALYWKHHAIESPSTDSARISIYGVEASGAEILLHETVFTQHDSILNLSSLVDANQYPYIRLRAWFTDTSFFSPAQTERWQLLYTPAPEAAVNGSAGLYLSSNADTLQEGDVFDMAVAIENISDKNMDSLLVHYWIEDANRIRHYLSYARQDSLRSGEILLDTLQIDTRGFAGLNSVWMEVNPVPSGASPGQFDQLEQLHKNNFAQIPFYVYEDVTNPILDVTFDGMHILNGDIVSAKPMITISLNDENEFLVMNEESDTAFFALYITDPNGTQKRIYFRNGTQQVLNWYPSSGSNGKFKIEYEGEFLLDGKYHLLVQASDKSGNESGDYDYRIAFEVINRQTITEVMNYPNPFSTKTHFVFTLTGSEVPQQMKIQIMTVSGKVVREITQDELGPIRIGRNITDYYWDGTDQFGDRLANGVYLYRVVARSNGQDIEKRKSGADAYFTKGFGKMYLMR